MATVSPASGSRSLASTSSTTPGPSSPISNRSSSARAGSATGATVRVTVAAAERLEASAAAYWKLSLPAKSAAGT